MRPNLSAFPAMAASLAFALSVAITAPAFAHDGVHITDPYARSAGAVGASGAIFFVVDNHQIEDDRLVDVASDVAEKVELHTHIEDANGVMQMVHLEEGLPIAAMSETVLERGGNHVMLLGLTRELKDGDKIALTLTFERAGVVEVEVPVDNARKPEGHGMGHGTGHGADGADAGHSGHGMGQAMGHGMGNGAVDTTGLPDPEAIAAVMKAQFETPENPLTVEPVVVEGDHALASWAQGEAGGRALLEKRDGAWVIVLCGGADLRLPAFLEGHGVGKAAELSALFNATEDGLGADKVALYSSFEGVVMIDGASH